MKDINEDYLTHLLRNAGYPHAIVRSFTREPVDGKSHGGGELLRFRLVLQDGAQHDVPTSIILKTNQRPTSQSLDPGYERREVDCYAHNLFDCLGQRLDVPRAYIVHADETAGEYAIWMEDLGDAFAVEWTPDLLAQAVRDLAELHACWWERGAEWAQMPFLRERAQAMYDGLWGTRIATNCAAIESHQHQTAIARVFTPERRQLLIRLSTAADLVYPLLERLPQTLLHQDVWLPNLGRRAGKTVLIDWSYVGPGTPGAELGQMCALLFQMLDAEYDDQSLIAALYDGLTDRKLPISYDQVLAGYELSFCLRPAHALGGPILGGILSGRPTMVGPIDLDARLANADATFQRIERGARRL